MSEDNTPPAPPAAPPASPPSAKLRPQRFSFVWVIPIIAAVIAGYLGYRTIAERGPLATISFQTAEGLTVGQTQVKYKAVALGTVEGIDLAKDNRHVNVQVRMNNVGARFLTSHARFWVVRPRLNANDISALDTLVSGAFIAVDPGLSGGHPQKDFTGLEQPPGALSDEPGRTYTLMAENLGSLATGSPVFYRSVVVGEVLGYDLGNGLGPVKINVFVRQPFDDLVHNDTQFWNSSGIEAAIQGGVLQIQLQSIQALISGGVTFSVPPPEEHEAVSPNKAVFHLYASHQEAQADADAQQVPVVSYLTSSVSGLTEGAPVNVLGIQVGDVTNVSLVVDRIAGTVKARVEMRLQPERVFSAEDVPPGTDPLPDFQKLVNNGLRVEIGTASYITGQKDIELTIDPGQKPVEVTREGGALVLPSAAGGLDEAIASFGSISAKLNKVPFDQIGDNLNKLLITTNSTLGSSSVKDSLKNLNLTLQSANATLKSANSSYGTDSDFQHQLSQTLQQAQDALRTVQMLANYLDRHPQALLLGRGNN
jgi:paraquat-inducible protein B